MAKFLVVGDVHWRGISPRGRTDDYTAALEAKIGEVNDLAALHNVDAVIQTGDLLDSPNVEYSVLNRYLRVIRESSVPWLSIPGNHDLFASYLDGIGRTPFETLVAAGVITDVSRTSVHLSRTSVHLPGVTITGHGYDAETDVDLEQYLTGHFVPGVQHIHVVHGMIVPHRLPDDQKHTTIERLAEFYEQHSVVGRPDVLICGHYHTGFDTQFVGATMVINPGALCRKEASVTEINRPVQVALLTLEDGEPPTVEYIPLQSAKPGPEVLSRDHIVAADMREQRLVEFYDLLAEGKPLSVARPEDALEQLAKREDIPKPVVDECMHRLSRARETVATAE